MTRRAEALYRSLKEAFPMSFNSIIPVLNKHGILVRESAPRRNRAKQGPIRVGYYHRQHPGFYPPAKDFTPEPLSATNLIQVTRNEAGDYFYQYEYSKKDTYGLHPNRMSLENFDRWQKNEAWVYLGTENPLEKKLNPVHPGVKLGWYARNGKRDHWNLLNVTNRDNSFAYTRKGETPEYFASAEDMRGYISRENWVYLGTEEPAELKDTPVKAKEKKWGC